MGRTEALARLGRMTASDQRPVLPADELDDLLDAARVADRDGNLVTDPGYVPTWNLNAAAAEGWRRKAGKVAGDFTFSADDARYDKGAVLASMERMVAMYAAKDVGVMSTRVQEQPHDTQRLFANG